MTELAGQARALFDIGVAAADPGRCVAQAMAEVLADPPGPGGRWQVVALGKAALAMARAALARLPDGTPALIVTNPENLAGATGLPATLRVLAGDHPVPAKGSLAAGRAIHHTLAAMTPGDRLLALISGGGSALAVLPAPGLSLADKAGVARLLLASGADIGQMNLLRQQLSVLKGGGWLTLCAAPLHALILSDVPGDDLRTIASGPTVAPLGSRAQARALCHDLGIWARLPGAVRRHLEAPVPAVPRRAADNRLVGSNALSLAAMVAAGGQPAPFALAGGVVRLAPRIAALLAAMAPGQALVFGGETNVSLRGDGLGGRNQELALRVALAVEGAGLTGAWCFLAGGTDGRDGPTQAAGGALRITGATGTNVADLAVLLRGG